MKKIFSAIVALIMLTSSIPSYASEVPTLNFSSKSDKEMHQLLESDKNKEISADSKTYTFSETDIINSYKSMTDTQLESIGFTRSEINQIKSINITDELSSLSQYSTTELKAKGYSNADIENIQQYSTSGESLAYITITVSKDKFYYTNSFTSARIRIDWQWSHVPFWKFTDKLAASVAQVMYYNSSNSYSTVNYYIQETGSFAYSTFNDFNAEGPSSAVSTPIQMVRGVLNGIEWAKNGTAYVQFDVSSKYTQMGSYAAYGHSLVSFAPSVTVSTGGFLSFSPSVSVDSFSAYQLLN